MHLCSCKFLIARILPSWLPLANKRQLVVLKVRNCPLLVWCLQSLSRGTKVLIMHLSSFSFGLDFLRRCLRSNNEDFTEARLHILRTQAPRKLYIGIATLLSRAPSGSRTYSHFVAIVGFIKWFTTFSSPHTGVYLNPDRFTTTVFICSLHLYIHKRSCYRTLPKYVLLS